MVGTKVYVEALVAFDVDGNMAPVSLTFEDGGVYEIDRILEVRRGATLGAGPHGIRYTVRINGRQTYLFFEGRTEWSIDPEHKIIGRWFVERRQ